MPSKWRITPERLVMLGAALAAVIYAQDLRYDFILDDLPFILLNDTLASWRNWKILFRTYIGATSAAAGGAPSIAPTTAIHYRPIYVLWQMLNEQLFGLVIPWWHLTSLLLHVAVIFLVFQVGLRILKEPWAAAVGALLFAFHPIHVESVSYITASTDLLVALFSLVSFLAYRDFREGRSMPAAASYAAAVLTAALAMFSKETAVMFPWMLVAYEVLRPSNEPLWNWKRYVWTLPFFAIVGAYVSVRTILFGTNAGPGPGGNRLAALLDIPLVLAVYMKNLLIPTRLSFYYPAEWGSEWTFARGLAAAAAIAVAMLLWRSYRGRPGMRLLMLWAAIWFVPALLSVYTFIREDWVHDRHMYLVSAPVCLIAGALLTDARWPRQWRVAACSVALAFLAIVTAVNVPRFADSVTVEASAVAVAPRNVLALTDYASALWGYGRHDESLRAMRRAVELAPHSTQVHFQYASELAEVGRAADAKTEYQLAVQCETQLSPLRAYLDYQLAMMELKDSELNVAAGRLQEAVAIAPQTINYHAALAQALTAEGHPEQAGEQMRLEAQLRRQGLDQRANAN